MAEQPTAEEAVFLAALERVAPEERAAYVKNACGADSALRERVEELLRCHVEPRGPLDSPPPGLVATLDMPPIAERPGQTIGRYKLLEEIGEGGMGVVYMAEQREPVRRKVALKIIKPGMDTREVIARFEAERQALAIMDHPNVARILDGGATESGRPYFVMELVQGIPITEYCDRAGLTTRQRLALFVLVCKAVQHAHQKGIIHRDLKPSNVLVTLYDGVPVPKIIDFGIAKALQSAEKGAGPICRNGPEGASHKLDLPPFPLTEKSLFTGLGRMMGTPMYMSPEQAEMSALDIDTQSDIYSLGVVLYELLTGRTPFDQERVQQAGYDEIRRMIREEEPPRPSHRLSTLDGEAVSTITAHRGVDARRLGRLLRGDLDWIVMKALQKDRTRRYESASALAADVQRHLANEPIEARPPTLADRAAKWARRHRPLVWSAVALLLLLTVGSAIGALLIARERTRTAQALDAETGQRQRAEQNLRMALDALDKVYLTFAEKEANDLLYGPDDTSRLVREITPEHKELLQKALAFYEEFLRVNGDEPSVRREAVRAYVRVGRIRQILKMPKESDETAGQAVDLAQRLVAEFPESPECRDCLVYAYRERGWMRGKRREFDNAIADYEDALRLKPDDWIARRELARNHVGRGLQHRDAARRAEAMRDFDQAIREVTQVIDASPPFYDTYHVRGDAYFHSGFLDRARFDKAIADYTTAIRLNPKVFWSRYNRGGTYAEKGEFDKALADFHDAMQLEKAPRPIAFYERGRIYLRMGQLENAIADFSEAIRLDPNKHSAYLSRGIAYHRLGKLPEAIADASEAIRMRPKEMDGGYYHRGIWNQDLGRLDDAIDDYTETIRLNPKDCSACVHRAVAYRRLGKVPEAIADYSEAIRLDPKSRVAYANRGNAYEGLGKLPEAIADYSEAIRLDPKDCSAYVHRAFAYGLLGKLPEAIADYREAVRFDPKNCTAYANRALAYVRLGKLPEAIADYSEAIRLDPKSRVAYYERGSCNQRLRRLDAAIADYTETIRVQPGYHPAYLRRAEVYRLKGDFERAVADLRTAIELKPEAPGGYLNSLAWLLATCPEVTLRDPARAVALAEKAVGVAPEERTYLNTLGAARYRACDWNGSIEALKKSMALSKGGNALDWFFLAMAHWQLGHKEEARRWYDKAVEWTDKSKPSDEEVVRFRAEAAELLVIADEPPTRKGIQRNA